MKVYCAYKIIPFEGDELVGIAKTQKGALAILKREFPDMKGIGSENLISDADDTYFLTIEEANLEE